MTRLFFLLAFLVVLSQTEVLSMTPDEFFETKIRPVLVESCFKCHGVDKTSNGLRLDRRDHLMTGGERGPAIIPGQADNSLLIQAMRRTHADLAMPPKQPLPIAVVNDFQTWIDAGAAWPESGVDQSADAGRHWAFLPIRDVEVPVVNDAASTHPIDRFIAARQTALGLRSVARADQRTLIRRASFDLTGLPPSWERTVQFSEDQRPEAFAELVDELLASPRYGERWGRHWLDLARYADTAGENSDYPIPQAYLYRDYVIDAFNSDKPYDEFIQEQIAGDIIGRNGPPEEYAQRVIATGFIAQSKRFGTNDLEAMHLIIEDTLDTMGKVVLGLGLRCARCHDHKYDPTTTEDYYGLYGFFQSTAYPFPGGESVREQRYFVPTIDPSTLAAADKDFFAKHADDIDRLKQLIQSETDVQANKKALAEIEARAPSRLAPVAYAVTEGNVADAKVQHGGNPYRKGEVVRRRFPEFLSLDRQPEISSQESGRLQLARWLTDRDNPLTARVIVNRIWQFHFGKPIVPTPSNFGQQGSPPTHPDLLDWLAQQLIENDWSIKAMHRLIMSSATYQLTAAHDPHNAAIDSGNKYYWRFDRRRMDAESIRDSMLLLAGNLDLSRPGAHPFPAKDKWKWTAHRQFKAVYPSNHRSVYLMVQRLHPHPFLSIFNGPNTSTSTAMRDRSTVPLQALFMTNSELVDQQARGLAESLITAGGEPGERIQLAYRRVLLRSPSGQELDRAAKFIEDYQRVLVDEGVPPEEHQRITWASFARTLLTANEFLFVD
ncbi:PSD1 and planctomycete cytochrome C domain-containing protein [Stieleria sp.]|uniref:PSD1 and planctomycete cytochrome C domain-containing protein n=1 Tax=Stieleria sp. TaxID=2795976 RepID=UPI0035650947